MTPHSWCKTRLMAGPYDLVHTGWKCKRCGTSVGILPEEVDRPSPGPSAFESGIVPEDCDVAVVKEVMRS